MRIVSIDGGAERMGWAMLSRTAIVNGSPALYYHMSGLLSLAKGANEKYQDYRVRLTTELVESVPALLELWDPDELVTEVLPPQGFGSPFQSYLTNVGLTVVHTLAIQAGIPVKQISARTVQAQIAIRGKSKKISKVQVRNGVTRIFPELEERKNDWTKVFDEPDAIAVGAAYLGARNG